MSLKPRVLKGLDKEQKGGQKFLQDLRTSFSNCKAPLSPIMLLASPGRSVRLWGSPP